MFNCQKYNIIKEFIKKKGKNTKIISISKNHPKEFVTEAMSCGVRVFGENRVQEAKKKFEDIKTTRNIKFVIKGGVIYDPEKLFESAEGMIGPRGPNDHERWKLVIEPLRSVE